MAMSGAERQKAYRERQKELLAVCDDPEETAIIESHLSSGKSGKSGKKPRANRSFIAIDGEALGESGYHLLAASTGDEIADRSEKGLSSADCLRFLLALKKRHGVAV